MIREVLMMMPVGTVVEQSWAQSWEQSWEQSWDGAYFYNGLIGAAWAIIAGPIGIHISNSKKLHQIKCLWNFYIPLISIGILSTISGFGLGVDSLLKNSNGIYINGIYIDYIAYTETNYNRRELRYSPPHVRVQVKAFIGLLYIETIVLFGKFKYVK